MDGGCAVVNYQQDTTGINIVLSANVEIYKIFRFHPVTCGTSASVVKERIDGQDLKPPKKVVPNIIRRVKYPTLHVIK